MTEKTKKFSLFKTDDNFVVEKVIELNFFDLTGEKIGNKGTSNKSYHIEIQIFNNKAQIYTLFGPTGGHQTADWRHYDDLAKARKEFESIIKSKIKKGYKEIDVAQRVYGSSAAKEITKTVELKNVDKSSATTSSLHIETQKLISNLMGSTNNFVIQTLKCPLGQLTNNQIDEGRNKLNEAKTLINNGNVSKSQLVKLQDLTNEFYSLIPHNLGSGARGKMEHLLLDDLNKINQKEYDLDTLLDAKSIGAVLTSNSVDTQYDSLKTEMNYIDKADDLFGWLNDMMQKTTASNHYYFKNIKLINAWKINRVGERDIFKDSLYKISKECKKWNVPDILWKMVKNRSDIPDELEDLYKKSNVVPLFHGTRSCNLAGGILSSKGMLIRPSNVVLCGSMYGNGIYYASNSTKSINYTSINSSYWAKGNDDKGYLLIADCCLGNQKIAQSSYMFTENNIKPNHSVWAKSGYSGIINDEFILYNTKQHHLRYLLEFTCKNY